MYTITARILISLLFLFCFYGQAFSASDLGNGTAIGVSINAKDVKDGAIISSTKEGYKLTVSPYDAQIFGVISMNPAVYLMNSSAPSDLPLISNGQVKIRVSSINGNIKKGDFITSSKIPGVAQLATENGFVVGTAGEDYSSNDPNKIGMIEATLHPHFAKLSNDLTRNLMNSFNMGFTAALETPLGAVRYMVSGLIVLLSFFFGFRFFGKASNKGVEAIGRNPLAKQAILTSILINSIITIAVMFFGVAIAYLILVL